MGSRSRFLRTLLAFGYAFLYLPIALVAVYSFNESRLVTVWAGFSTKWWSALFANDAMLEAAFLSLKIALLSATVSALLGLVFVLVGIGQLFKAWNLLYSKAGAVYGAGYTDVHIRLPTIRIAMAICCVPASARSYPV